MEIRTSIPTYASSIPGYRSGIGLHPFATIHSIVWTYANTGVIWKATPSEQYNNRQSNNKQRHGMYLYLMLIIEEMKIFLLPPHNAAILPPDSKQTNKIITTKKL